MYRKRLCQVFSPVATKMNAANGICSHLQAANETLQESIQGFADLVIQATGTDPNFCDLSCEKCFVNKTPVK